MEMYQEYAMVQISPSSQSPYLRRGGGGGSTSSQVLNKYPYPGNGDNFALFGKILAPPAICLSL